MGDAMGAMGERARELGRPRVRVMSPDHRALAVNSPNDSDGTEFFDAHEEIPWTPERPMWQSPIMKRDGHKSQRAWVDGGARVPPVDASAGPCDSERRMVESIWSPAQIQVRR